jgi:hypothetical protein
MKTTALTYIDPTLELTGRMTATSSANAITVIARDVGRAFLPAISGNNPDATGTLRVQNIVLLGVIGLLMDVVSRVPEGQATHTRWLSHIGRATASTAPTPVFESADYWSTELPAQIAHWARAERDDDIAPLEAAQALEKVLSQAGICSFLILYDLLSQPEKLSIAEACTLVRALGQSGDPLVRKYRGRLFRQALGHASATVRDAAALAIYEAEERSELSALRAARDRESNRYVRRGMTQVLEALP